MGIRINTTNTYKPKVIARGQMWWANIPHDDLNPHAQHGFRPVVVVSNDRGNKHSPSLLVCPLTTQKDKYFFIHPNVMCRGTLSYVQCEQIKVIDKSLLRDYIGKIRDVEQDYIDRALAKSIGLNNFNNNSESSDKSNELEAAKSKIEELQKRVAELESEANNNKEMIELGLHVKGIMSILSKSIECPSSQPFGYVDKNNMEESIKSSSQPDDKASETEYHSSKPIIRESAIDKFNRRYGNLSTTSTKSSKPKKWTDETIESFMEDFDRLDEMHLIIKYDLNTYDTAKKYYRKFKKERESL